MNVECPHCKASIQVPISNAGEKARCPYCTGEFLLPTPAGYAPNQTPPVGTPKQPMPHYQEFVEKKVVAGILGMLFGAFGVHKFYLGIQSSAKIMLVVSIASFLLGSCLLFPMLILVGMSAVGFIEGLIYLTMNDERFYQVYGVEKKPWF